MHMEKKTIKTTRSFSIIVPWTFFYKIQLCTMKFFISSWAITLFFFVDLWICLPVRLG
jgi:hypothetical protein